MKTKTILKFQKEQIIEFCVESGITPLTDECGCKYYEIHNYSMVNDVGRAYIHRCDRHLILFRKFKRNVSWKVTEPKVIILGDPKRKCRILKEEDIDDNS